MSDDAMDFLLQRATTVACPKDTCFFREGDQAQSVYILESGRTALIKRWKNRNYLLRHLEPGNCFGEMALMDMYPRSATAMAVADSTAFKINSSALHELYQIDMEQFTRL